MTRLLLIGAMLLMPLLASAAEPITFKQTLARVADEREPGLMVDIYGEYPVSSTTFWTAVYEFIGADRADAFPPYMGTPEGQAWHAIYPHAIASLDSPYVLVRDPDALQRLAIARFLDTYRRPPPTPGD